MDAVADREGFAVLYPAAVAGRWAYVDTRPVPLPNGGGNADDTLTTPLIFQTAPKTFVNSG